MSTQVRRATRTVPPPTPFDGTSNSAIYAIIHIPTTRFYVGSTKNMQNRWAAHKSKLKLGKHPNSYLQSTWNKQGKDEFVFRVLELVPDNNLLREREEHWIQTLESNVRRHGFNLTAHSKGREDMQHSPVARKKISEHHKKRMNSPDYVHHQAKLTPNQVTEIIYGAIAGKTSRELASIYGCAIATVQNIRANKIWRQLPIEVETRDLAQCKKTVKAPRISTRNAVTDEMKREISSLLKNGYTQRSIAERFGIHYSTICQMKRRGQLDGFNL